MLLFDDFGYSGLRARCVPVDQPVDSVIGTTPGYLAPEQQHGGDPYSAAGPLRPRGHRAPAPRPGARVRSTRLVADLTPRRPRRAVRPRPLEARRRLRRAARRPSAAVAAGARSRRRAGRPGRRTGCRGARATRATLAPSGAPAWLLGTTFVASGGGRQARWVLSGGYDTRWEKVTGFSATMSPAWPSESSAVTPGPECCKQRAGAPMQVDCLVAVPGAGERVEPGAVGEVEVDRQRQAGRDALERELGQDGVAAWRRRGLLRGLRRRCRGASASSGGPAAGDGGGAGGHAGVGRHRLEVGRDVGGVAAVLGDREGRRRPG